MHIVKRLKILNIFLLITSLLGYMEWGGNNNALLFQAEAQIFIQGFQDISSIAHPLIILPILGQILLLICILRKQPLQWLNIAGIISIALLLELLLFISIISFNYKMLLSVLPFNVLAILIVLEYKKSAKH